MLKIQRSKSCDAILITLKNLDKGDNQSQLSFRVYDNSTVFDLIVHIQKTQQVEVQIQLYFEQNVQFMGDMNQYIIDIIKRTRNRSFGYRIYQQQFQSKSESLKINQQGHSEIQYQKRIMATQIPIQQYSYENFTYSQLQNKFDQNSIKNKENYPDQNDENLLQAQNNQDQYQQFMNLSDKQKNLAINEQQQNNYDGQNMFQNKAFKELEFENQTLQQSNQILENKIQQLIQENSKFQSENQFLKNRSNFLQGKEISPLSQKIKENRLSESISFTNKCSHQIKERNLEEILIKALHNKQIAKCLQCNKNISNSLCRQIKIYGVQYIEMKNQLDFQNLILCIQKQDKNLKLVECSNYRCDFVCIWQQKLPNQQPKGFCINCLQYSVEYPPYKSKSFAALLSKKGIK
ncbi:unnamed protein product [Paramecium sonneborni]|uniref:Uncharacterized protein n=1 Tax=Paramecium sonneborni TaxID=65129 RepID=A0A8S1LWZ6_9CILI|nr:unnamed protein product [Paramecium sonneborni]